MNNNFLNKEVYVIADFKEDYVGLIVCIYEFSQFYILFNKKIFNTNYNEKLTENQKKTSKFLKELIKKASKDLNYKIDKISYNIDIKNFKIVKHEYFHNYNSLTILTLKEIEKLNKNFIDSVLKIKDKEIVFTKINNYFLIDTNENINYVPLNKTISSIKISGLVYFENWKTLFFYEGVFKKIKIKTISPLLLPYSIYIGLLFTQKNKDVIILNWNKKSIDVFKFQNKIFDDFLLFKKNGLLYFFEKVSIKLNYELSDIKDYYFQIANLNKQENKSFELFLESFDKQLKENKDKLNLYIKEYIKSILKKILEEIKNKVDLTFEKYIFFLVGDIVNIAGLKKFLKKEFENINFKIHNPLFTGIKTFEDSLLIGNAYYQHLKNKIIYN